MKCVSLLLEVYINPILAQLDRDSLGYRLLIAAWGKAREMALSLSMEIH